MSDRAVSVLLAVLTLAVASGTSCDRAPDAGLEDVRWVPVRIGDRVVTVAGQQREPWIMLDSHSKRLSGSGGCNRVSGPYQAGKGTLELGPLASTRMACLEGDASEIETLFLRALDQTRRFKVSGRTLELTSSDGTVLATLEERTLR